MSAGGGGAGLMSCVREGSLEPPYRPPHDPHHGEGRTNRFLRGLRRMFKRRGSGARASSPGPKSSSTSELLEAEQHRRKEGAYGCGLSVSHDSVFTGERSDESSDEKSRHITSSHRADLVAAVRRRGRDGSDDDEDLGLPRSPPGSPPTDKADKRHHAGISHSSCSDGSLLSVGSSEMDEDSSSGRHYSHDHFAVSDHSDFYNLSEPPSGLAPLSHSAAKHKMAVRPRRTHGAPRRKKNSPIAATALPITPELNEEMIRSATPDVTHRTSEVVTESYSSSTTTKHVIVQQLRNRELHRVLETPNDTKLKSSSLPPGLALSQLVGHSPTKLSIAESNTPRSSIKRSKSSSQEQSQRDSPVHRNVDSHIQTYHSEERMSKYRIENKYAEETCLEKKSKSEKKIENENIKTTKKEESFFSRLLLRKSGKKSKKEQTEGEGNQEVKKSKTNKPSAYKPVEEKPFYNGEQCYPVPAERTYRTTGQKVFANQMHKRIDNKGAYVQESAYKDIYSAANVSGINNLTDLKIAEETDKMLNLEMKNRFSRREEFVEKIERTKRTPSKENIEEKIKRESFNLQHEKAKRPISVQKLTDPFYSKPFINNEQSVRAQEENLSPTLISDEEPPIRAMRIKNHNDYTFHSGSMPKNIPYFNPSIVVTDAPVKSIRKRHQSSENVKHRSSEKVSEFNEERRHKIEELETINHVGKAEETYGTGLRSLGDEYVETRSSIRKSHSFRYASETTSISSQESQMPSLPAIVGISEPLLESWEVNYRRNVTDRHDYSKRVSARNYSLLGNTETYDSLPSTDSSYMDSLKTDVNEDRQLFTHNIDIKTDSRKRDSDISQIEAKIDDIIGSPKPIIASILKSSSLDSVKSSPEKPIDDRRKTISVESALSQCAKNKDVENFISVTHINKEQTLKAETPKNKSDEKIQKSGTKPGNVPEFLNIQLNRVGAKPTTNVVLTANVTPKKLDSPQAEKEQEIECFKVTETKQSITVKKETQQTVVSKKVESLADNIQDKISPVATRKSSAPIAPQSPSTPKGFFKRKSISVDLQEISEKPRTNSMSTEGSIEKIYDNISMDRKSHSSYGSKSSIQSTDSNEIKHTDKDDAVVYRKKTIMLKRDKKDDEPELMKVFARRSLKIKDTEADSIAQQISEANKGKDEVADNNATRSKLLKNEFNASIKSRDSDKENEDTKEQAEEKRLVDIAARVSQFGQYQRSVSITSVSNPKRESAPCRNEVNKYKKEVSDSTPEKRLRNRTFPDPTNDRQDIQNIAKNETMGYKADTLKRPWQNNERNSVEENRDAVIEKDENKEKQEGAVEKDGAESQYKGILQRRAEWERRAKQGMTK